MRQRRRATIHELRLAVECLPRATRVAMLQAIQTNKIIAGAYSDAGGICPMLAAHRAGGRTSAIAFARAWDRFAFRDSRRSRPRRATERELLVLKSHLEMSLLKDEAPVPAPRARPGDPDRTDELRFRPGWAWTRVVRRYDDYRNTLAWLAGEEAAEPVDCERPRVA